MKSEAKKQSASSLSGKTALLIAQSPTESQGFRSCLRETGILLHERDTSQLNELFDLALSKRFAFILFDCEESSSALQEVQRLRQVPDSPVIYAAHLNTEHAVLAEQYGASILWKPCEKQSFIACIENCIEAPIPSLTALTRVAVQHWDLSPQQARVLFFNLWSFSNDEIARVMGLSLHTILDYQNTLRRKTGARSKDGYLRRILECNGVSPPPAVLGEPNSDSDTLPLKSSVRSGNPQKRKNILPVPSSPSD